jgi:hypothetical protein
MRIIISITVLAAWHTSAVLASEATHPCAALREPQARLACYDRAFGVPADVPQATQNTPVANTPEPATRARPLPPAVAAVPAPATVDAGAREDEFGLTPQQARRARLEPQAAEAETGPASVTATVTELRKQATGPFIAVLDNGQVWAQRETNTRVRLKIGEQVTIRRGTLGSYLLEGSSGLATRVRRIQ